MGPAGKYVCVKVNMADSSQSTGTTKQLDFTPMDAFIAHVLETFRIDAQTAVEVFPSSARVVISFCDRVASDVVGCPERLLMTDWGVYTAFVAPDAGHLPGSFPAGDRSELCTGLEDCPCRNDGCRRVD